MAIGFSVAFWAALPVFPVRPRSFGGALPGPGRRRSGGKRFRPSTPRSLRRCWWRALAGGLVDMRLLVASAIASAGDARGQLAG